MALDLNLANIGAFLAPFVLLLQNYVSWLPNALLSVLGKLTLFNTILSLL